MPQQQHTRSRQVHLTIDYLLRGRKPFAAFFCRVLVFYLEEEKVLLGRYAHFVSRGWYKVGRKFQGEP